MKTEGKSQDQSGSDRSAIRSMWRDAWSPPDRRSPWEWAEDNVLAIPYSPIPSRFRSDNSPWIRKPLDALVDADIRKVQIVAGIQSSKTFLSEIGSCYIIKNMPGPMLWLDQKDEEAQDEMENRLKPLWNHTPVVKDLVPSSMGRNRYKNKRNQITFLNAMTAWVLGAHNIKNLQRRSIRWLIGDETWSWPPGHMAEAEARVTAFDWLGKVFFSSQAGEEDDDTDRSFRAGTQEEWNYVCLNGKCQKLQPYAWDHVEWSKEAKIPEGGYDYEMVRKTARIICSECGHSHDTSQIRTRRLMNDTERGADFVVMNPDAPKNYRSFHWNGLCSTPAGTLAEIYLRAKQAAKQGDLEPLKIFYQKRLAVPWNDNCEDFKMEIEKSTYFEGDEWDEECIITRKGKAIRKPDIPLEEDFLDDDGELLEKDFEAEMSHYTKMMRGSVRGRMILVDCQRDHFWVTVDSFTEAGDTRLLWCGGGREDKVNWPSDDIRYITTWDEIEDLQKKWEVANHLVFVDAGYDTSRVYLEAGRRGWTCLMGDRRSTFSHRIKPTRDGDFIKKVDRFYSAVKRVNIGGGVVSRLHYYSNLNIKDILARIRTNQDPEKGVTYEVPDNVPEEFLRQMDSEQRVKQTNGKSVWQQIGARPNHFWDCQCMKICALIMMKLIGRESVADNDPPEESP